MWATRHPRTFAKNANVLGIRRMAGMKFQSSGNVKRSVLYCELRLGELPFL